MGDKLECQSQERRTRLENESLLKCEGIGTFAAHSFLEATTMSAPAPSSPTEFLTSMLPMIVIMGAVMWFFSIRPQMRKQKEHAALIGGLKKGDRVLTQAGFYADVISVEADRVVVSLGDSGRVEMAKSAILGIDTAKA
jgi:preprotein translocase subunit YajC